jgi:cysteine desulfurase
MVNAMNRFFDAASAGPLNPGGRQALAAAFDSAWADPQRWYADARRARLILDASRAGIAAAMTMGPTEVAFASSSALAGHWAVSGALRARPGRVVCSSVEHSALLAAAETAAGSANVSLVGVDHLGRIDLDTFAHEISQPGVTLACLQVANHEVGTRQPLPVATALCQAAGVPLLVDAAMTIGRGSDLMLGVDQASLVLAQANSWGGPAGVAALGVRKGVPWQPPAVLDQREHHHVPGLPLTPLIAVAARALEWTLPRQNDDARLAKAALHDLRDLVLADVSGSSWLGDPDNSLPYLGAFSCLYTDAESLMGGLDTAGFAVSSGSSCVADTRRPSHVLAAMGAASGGNVRVSLPVGDTTPDIGGFVAALRHTVNEIRHRFGAQDLPGL